MVAPVALAAMHMIAVIPAPAVVAAVRDAIYAPAGAGGNLHIVTTREHESKSYGYERKNFFHGISPVVNGWRGDSKIAASPKWSSCPKKRFGQASGASVTPRKKKKV
jgi:hypothetical protein